MLLRDFGFATLAAVLLGGSAMAQPANAPKPAAPAAAKPTAGTAQPQPQGQPAIGQPTDVQTFGDWTVRCFPVKAVAPCDMLQAAINKQTKQRVISVSLAYVPSQDTYAAQIVVPLGVALARGLTIAAGAHKIEGVKFRRCEHDGCYVEAVLNKASIEGFSSAGNTATINVFPYRRSQVVSLPMSLNGFGQALAKLKELARQKAVTPPPAATPSATPAPATH